jgi:putative tryptophan/tyrosine transport system substrate-binding protein
MAAEYRRLSVSRRQFVQGAGAAGLALLAGCGRWPGQSAESSKVPQIGLLNLATSGRVPANEEVFLQALREHGYTDGHNVIIERRAPERPEELRPLAAELVALPVDVLFAAGGTLAAIAAKEATSTIPIVASSGDLVGTGLVTSLARPGGNVTGLSSLSPQLSGKRLQLLLDVVPGASRLALIWNPASATATNASRETRVAAEALGVAVHPLEVRASSDFEAAFEVARDHADAATVMGDPLTLQTAAEIAMLAAKSRLPTMYQSRDNVAAGGLMAYGSNLSDRFRRSAYYVDRILKGAKPADLPVEQPTTFDFLINVRVAGDLGLAIPPHVLLQATEVIQ